MPDRAGGRPVLFYDLASPESYLAAERSHHVLGVVPEWRPIRDPAGAGAPSAAERGRIEELARERGLQQLRWPPLPLDSELALLAAAYAAGIGKVVAFSLAAFRQAFAAGRPLDETTVLLAGAACEIHPRALLAGARTRGVVARLEEACGEARSLGVERVPAILAGGRVFHGDAALEEAAAGSVS